MSQYSCIYGKVLIKGSQESERTVTGIKKVTVTVTYEGRLNAAIGSSNFSLHYGYLTSQLLSYIAISNSI